MKQEQAHQNVAKKFQAGLISRKEATIYHNRIIEVVESDRDQEQKDALIAIWGK